MNTNLQKLLRSAAAVLCLTASMTATASVAFLKVNLTDGSEFAFALADQPIVKTTEGHLTVEASEGNISVPFDKLISYSFTSQWTALKDMGLKGDYTLSQGHILFGGLPAGEMISVFDAAGILAAEGRVDSEGRADVDISDLPTGVYVVSTSTATFKILTR